MKRHEEYSSLAGKNDSQSHKGDAKMSTLGTKGTGC